MHWNPVSLGSHPTFSLCAPRAVTMVFYLRRCSSPFRWPANTMRGKQSIASYPWFIPSQTLRPYTLYRIQNSSRPRQDPLEEAILSSPQLVFDATADREQESIYRANVFARLKLRIPEKLPDSFTSSEQYASMLKRLVVEEALFSVTSKLERFCSEAPGQLKGRNLRLKIVDDGDGPSKLRSKHVKRVIADNMGHNSTEYRRVDAYSYKPLSAYYRRNLRAGAVVILIPVGKNLIDVRDVVFGYIHRGSDRSATLPAHMQVSNSKKEKKVEKKDTENEKGKKVEKKDTENKKGKKVEKKDAKSKKAKPLRRGDRLVLRIFGDVPAELELCYLTTLLSSIRRFRACDSLVDIPTTLKEELLGNKAPPDCPNEVEDIESHFSDVDSESSTSHRLQKDLAESRITIPTLNDSQQRACDAFLSDRGANIRIVQGPLGTGKTTMIVATILRYFLKPRSVGDERRLMVCGPSNKSVVVLMRKILQCLNGTDTLKVALIGDKDELFADYQDEISEVYVHSYLDLMASKWKDAEKYVLSDTSMYDKYEQDTSRLLSGMKSRLKTTNFMGLEESLLDVREVMNAIIHSSEAMETLTDDVKELRKEFRRKVKIVTLHIKNLDAERVVGDLLSSADVIFCTLIASGSVPVARMRSVDGLIVDEASACTEPDILIPLRKGPSRMLLVGDPKQLPSVVSSPLAFEYGFSRSLQDRLMFRNGFDFTLLDEQYRMRPEISEWPLKTFYESKVADGDNVIQKTYNSDVRLLDGEPYCWVQVSSEERKDKFLSTYNAGEAEALVSIILLLKRKYGLSNDWFSADRLRVITFYQAQVDHINLLLRKHKLGNVVVSTVDSSQGCEADIVIVSFVRGSSGHVGFLKDNRRLNVGLTRVKFQLVCVGNLHAISHLADRGGHLQLVDLARDAFDRARIHTTSKLSDGNITSSRRS